MSARTKTFSAEDFFVREMFTTTRKNLKSSKRRFGKLICNEDQSMPISRNTNVCVFAKAIVCGPRRFKVGMKTVLEELKLYGWADRYAD